ncbi:MAG TPA: transcriptional repressor LexA [Blastocatellia bacterium]|nr:transcriptional repressor LexA [Blastocatellia bacterium]
MALTTRQQAMHDFLCRYQREFGQPPTLAEIQAQFGLRTRAGVAFHLAALERAGFIERIPNVTRGIKLLQGLVADEEFELPLLGVVSAGQPIEAVLTREVVSIPRDLYKPHRFALRVRGDSMIDEQIADGDIIIVEPSQTAKNGDKVIALIDDTSATIKKFYLERKTVRLEPANPKYKPLLISPPARVKIQGILAGLIRRYGR